MSVCMYVCLSVCMYGSVCMILYVWFCMYDSVCLYVCMSVWFCMSACWCVGMLVCWYIGMFVCLYDCMILYVRTYVVHSCHTEIDLGPPYVLVAWGKVKPFLLVVTDAPLHTNSRILNSRPKWPCKRGLMCLQPSLIWCISMRAINFKHSHGL